MIGKKMKITYNTVLVASSMFLSMAKGELATETTTTAETQTTTPPNWVKTNPVRQRYQGPNMEYPRQHQSYWNIDAQFRVPSLPQGLPFSARGDNPNYQSWTYLPHQMYPHGRRPSFYPSAPNSYGFSNEDQGHLTNGFDSSTSPQRFAAEFSTGAIPESSSGVQALGYQDYYRGRSDPTMLHGSGWGGQNQYSSFSSYPWTKPSWPLTRPVLESGKDSMMSSGVFGTGPLTRPAWPLPRPVLDTNGVASSNRWNQPTANLDKTDVTAEGGGDEELSSRSGTQIALAARVVADRNRQMATSWTQGLPNWHRSYSLIPGTRGCYNRCRPLCDVSNYGQGCISSCRPSCNLAPRCGNSAGSWTGNTMACGRPNYSGAYESEYMDHPNSSPYNMAGNYQPYRQYQLEQTYPEVDGNLKETRYGMKVESSDEAAEHSKDQEDVQS